MNYARASVELENRTRGQRVRRGSRELLSYPNSVLSAIDFRATQARLVQDFFDRSENRASARLVDPVIIVAHQQPSDFDFSGPRQQIGFDRFVRVVSIYINPVESLFGE